MIHLTAESEIRLATQPADFRKGIDGFVALCEQQLKHNPRSGMLFVFRNRAATMVRILSYERSGYWLCTKRLSRGKYRGWPRTDKALNVWQAQQLRLTTVVVHTVVVVDQHGRAVVEYHQAFPFFDR